MTPFPELSIVYLFANLQDTAVHWEQFIVYKEMAPTVSD